MKLQKKCNITKKAVQYYVERGMLIPKILENGYKDFSEQDAEILKQIVLYRKLGFSTSEIKRVFHDESAVTHMLYQRTLEVEREKVKLELLKRLDAGEKIEALEEEINHINSNTIIIKKLMELFPSYYGRFISLNFSIMFLISICRKIYSNTWISIWKCIPVKRESKRFNIFLKEKTGQFGI